MTQIYHRKLQQLFEERVFGGSFINLGYKNAFGRRVVSDPTFQRVLSKLVGAYQHSPFSKAKVKRFIEDYQTQIDDFEVPAAGFKTFNEFFIRKYKEGSRKFPDNPNELGAMAEGRLTVFPISRPQFQITVKDHLVSLRELLANHPLQNSYVGGYAFVFRLCPVDYHRFHFPDSGTIQEFVPIEGGLNSVNPASLEAFPETFLKNERQLTLFDSDHFGILALIDVGATCVGKIVQTHTSKDAVSRGQEKGYFEFGGSTCIMLSQKGFLSPDEDLLLRSRQGTETLVDLGEKIGIRAIDS